MNQHSYKFADNFNLPLIISDTDGTVLYKNTSAKNSIKYIRMSSNIQNMLVRKNSIDLKKPEVCVATFFCERSLYSSAFLCPFKNGDDDLWLWMFSLYFLISEDLTKRELFIIKDFADYLITLLLSTDDNTQISSIKYSRMGESLLKMLTHLNYTFLYDDNFRLHNVISSVCQSTREIADLHNLRIELDSSMIDPNSFFNISFRSFSTLYMHTILTLFKLSDYHQIEIVFSQFCDKFVMTLYSLTEHREGIPLDGTDLHAIASVYPDNYLNILAMEKMAQFSEYHIEYSWNTPKLLELRFIKDISKGTSFLAQPNNAALALLFSLSEKEFRAKIHELFQKE